MNEIQENFMLRFSYRNVNKPIIGTIYKTAKKEIAGALNLRLFVFSCAFFHSKKVFVSV